MFLVIVKQVFAFLEVNLLKKWQQAPSFSKSTFSLLALVFNKARAGALTFFGSFPARKFASDD